MTHFQTRQRANLIPLVDRVDALAAPYDASGQVLKQRQPIQREIDARRGTCFDPVQVDLSATHAEMLQLARIFSVIVDAKSPFTREHSLVGVDVGIAQVLLDHLDEMMKTAQLADQTA